MSSTATPCQNACLAAIVIGSTGRVYSIYMLFHSPSNHACRSVLPFPRSPCFLQRLCSPSRQMMAGNVPPRRAQNANSIHDHRPTLGPSCASRPLSKPCLFDTLLVLAPHKAMTKSRSIAQGCVHMPSHATRRETHDICIAAHSPRQPAVLLFTVLCSSGRCGGACMTLRGDRQPLIWLGHPIDAPSLSTAPRALFCRNSLLAPRSPSDLT